MNYPRSHEENNVKTQYITINGRRMPIQEGITRNELQVIAGGPGRRTVTIGSDGVEVLEAKPIYYLDDFRDSQGNLCQVSSIPDRTKGDDGYRAERILIFLDVNNIETGAKPFSTFNYGDLLNYLCEGRFLIDAYAYIGLNPRRPEEKRPLIQHLQHTGWLVHEKMGRMIGQTDKSSITIEMCLDMLDSAYQIKPDIIVLCSGNGEFLPLVRRLRRMGIRTEVAAFEHTVDAELPYMASGFISLDVWQNELKELYPNEPLKQDDDAATEPEQDSEPATAPEDLEQNSLPPNPEYTVIAQI